MMLMNIRTSEKEVALSLEIKKRRLRQSQVSLYHVISTKSRSSIRKEGKGEGEEAGRRGWELLLVKGPAPAHHFNQSSSSSEVLST